MGEASTRVGHTGLMSTTEPAVSGSSQRIVVGIDGSDGGDRALRFAVDEARCRGARVEAVLAWGLLDQPGVPEEEPFNPRFGETEALAYLTAAVEAAVGAEPGVDIDLLTACDLPVRALLSRAMNADLLVVGARGLGGFRGLLLGSVSQQVVSHSPCPVAVVPAPPKG